MPLIVNDRPDLAKRSVQPEFMWGLSDMGIEKARELLGEDFIIGGSAHNVKKLCRHKRQVQTTLDAVQSLEVRPSQM